MKLLKKVTTFTQSDRSAHFHAWFSVIFSDLIPDDAEAFTFVSTNDTLEVTEHEPEEIPLQALLETYNFTKGEGGQC